MPSSLPGYPAGWIAFKVTDGFWLKTKNTKSVPLGWNGGAWAYPWGADDTTDDQGNVTDEGENEAPKDENFTEIRSMLAKVERDYAGINSSGGPQVAGRAEHAEIEVVKDSDILTPHLYQFVSTGEAFDQVIIVLPEEGGGTRVEWFLQGVNLTLFEFTGDRQNASTLNYSSDTSSLKDSKLIKTGASARFYIRREKIKLLYTSAQVRVAKTYKDANDNDVPADKDFRGWDTGTNTAIGSYPTKS